MHSGSLTRPKRLRADILLRERSLNLTSLARTTAARAAKTTLWLNICSSFVGRDCDEMGNHQREEGRRRDGNETKESCGIGTQDADIREHWRSS